MRRLAVLLVFTLLAACSGGDDDAVISDADGLAPTTAAGEITPPLLGDHWHVAFEASLCGVGMEHLEDVVADESGIHTHGDGLIHIHPFATRYTGAGATLGAYFETVGVTVDRDGVAARWRLPFEGECDGEPAMLTIVTWTDATDADSATRVVASRAEDVLSVPLDRDGGAIVLAFAPEGADIPLPASVIALAAPADVAGSPPPPDATGQGTPVDSALVLGFAAVLGTSPEPCGSTAAPDASGGACYELAPIALGVEGIESAEATFDGISQWAVGLVLTEDGIARFNDVAAACFNGTGACPTRMLAIVRDGEVLSAPTIQAPEFDRGDIQISGGYSEDEAKDLAEAIDP